MSDGLPQANNGTSEEKEAIRSVIARRGLCGLANDTKWNELLNAMRDYGCDVPYYRWKCVDGRPVGWEGSWTYHAPYPMMSVEWLDILFWHHPLRPGMSGFIWAAGAVESHADRIEAIVKKVGLDYAVGVNMIRIFGYSPKSMDMFDD